MFQKLNFWDKLQTCVVGDTWDPTFYSWIQDSSIRNSLEKIAIETKEDLTTLSNCLESFDVKVIRPSIDTPTTNFVYPPITPRDNLCMIDTTLYAVSSDGAVPCNQYSTKYCYPKIVEYVKQQGNCVKYTDNHAICGSMVYSINQRLMYSINEHGTTAKQTVDVLSAHRESKNINQLHQYGHIDGWFCPVTPGLIIAVYDPVRPGLLELFFKTYFKDWEVVYLPPTLQQDFSFRAWQDQHPGRWWVPGQEHNKQLTEFIDYYFSNWLGDVSETVFEVNMLVIDEKNIITSCDNPVVIDALTRHGVTPHIVNLRHHMFWDSGIHCLTADLDRRN